MHFGFSYVGLCFLLMLFVPNLLWTKQMPKDYLRLLQINIGVFDISDRSSAAACVHEEVDNRPAPKGAKGTVRFGALQQLF